MQLRHSSTLLICLLSAGCNTFADPDPFEDNQNNADAAVNDAGEDGGQQSDTGQMLDAGAIPDADFDLGFDAGQPASPPTVELPGYDLNDSWALRVDGPDSDMRIAGGESQVGDEKWVAVARRNTDNRTSEAEIFLLAGESPQMLSATELPQEPRAVLGHDLSLLGDSRLIYAGVGYRVGCTDPSSSEWGWRRIFQPIVQQNSSFETLFGECGEAGTGNQGVIGETILFQDLDSRPRMASFARGGRAVALDIESTQSDTYLETNAADLTSNRLRGAPGGVVFSYDSNGGFKYWAGMPAANDTFNADMTRVSGSEGFYEFNIAGADNQVFDLSNATVVEFPVLFGRINANNQLFVDRVDARFTQAIDGFVNGVSSEEGSPAIFTNQPNVVEIAADAPAGQNDHFAIVAHGQSGSYGLRIAHYDGGTPILESVSFSDIDWPGGREVLSLDIFTTRLASGALLLGVAAAWVERPEKRGYDVYVYEFVPGF